MKVLSIRHGEYLAEYDEQGRRLIHTVSSRLASLGELQAHQLSKELKKEGVMLDALYTSPYLRASQTTDIIASDLRVPQVFEIDDLKDVFPNSADGEVADEVEIIVADIFAHPIKDKPQEPLEHLVERVRTTMQTILSEATARNYSAIGLVSHGDTLSALDWVLKYSINPLAYEEMRNAFYLQKGESCEYTLDEKFRLLGEGRIIRVESVEQSSESFRDSRNREMK